MIVIVDVILHCSNTILCDMKPIYNMYMFNNQKETDLQNFKNDESLIVFFKVIALSNDVVAIIAHNKKYHIFCYG